MTDKEKLYKLRAALSVYANPFNWEFRPFSDDYYNCHPDEWVWDEPWIDQGVKWEDDGSARKTELKNPQEYAAKILEEINES
jgi:hypothetical protein